MTDIKRPDWVTDHSISERGEYAQFQMFSREGNDAVASTLLPIFRDAEHYGAGRDTIVKAVQQGIASLTKAYPEVHDTEPEWAITDALNDFLSEQGFATVGREVLF